MFALSIIVLRETQTNWRVQKGRTRVWKCVLLRQVQKLSLLSLEKRTEKRCCGPCIWRRCFKDMTDQLFFLLYGIAKMSHPILPSEL